MEKRKVCVFLGSRANYASIKSVMREIQNSPNLVLILFVAASALLDKYGEVVELIEKDGFEVHEKIFMIIEGENLVTMAQSTGLGLIELPRLLEKYQPDFFVIVGDRFEMLSAAITAVYMNVPVVHTMGGEFSGSIDEVIRHAITKLAHIHFPANEEARKTILQMGEENQCVFNVGCPRMDIVKEILESFSMKTKVDEWLKKEGVGAKFDINGGFLLVSQHPVTTEFGQGEVQINETLQAVKSIAEELNLPVIMLWPNADAGSDDIARGIRKFRERKLDSNFRFFKHLPFEIYVQLMYKTLCLIGNSSSGIREGSFIGTPVVNIGSRQDNRERGMNVIDVDYNNYKIKTAIQKQLEHGKYESDPIYGDGYTGKKIIQILSSINVNIQKKFIKRKINLEE